MNENTAPAAVEPGWKLVPLEPTEEMIRAGCLSQQATPEYDNYEDWFNSHSGGIVERIRSYLCKDFRAMIAAQRSAPPAALAKAYCSNCTSVTACDLRTNSGACYDLCCSECHSIHVTFHEVTSASADAAPQTQQIAEPASDPTANWPEWMRREARALEAKFP